MTDEIGTRMTEEAWFRLRDDGVVPEGWRWCPDCNGEGFIWTMGADPDLTESERECDRCRLTLGVVPASEFGQN